MMNGTRIQDYNQFAFGNPRKNQRGEYSFVSTLQQNRIELINVPAEIVDLSDVNATIEYSLGVEASKEGIQNLNFMVNFVELDILADRYPEDAEEYDLDIQPGVNIEIKRFRIYVGDSPIPTEPRKMIIDMQKGMDVHNFLVTVYFGEE
jgi:hypothetical protein